MIGFGVSGFARTPVSKATIIAVLILSLLLGMSRDRTSRSVSWNNLSQIWRLITCNFVFSSPPELFFGGIILYAFRTFERIFGSRKFASALVFFMTSSTLLQLIISACMKGAPVASSGPYPIIFGLFVYFFALIPSISVIKIAGVAFGEKFIMYLLAAQLALSSLPQYQSIVAAALGVFSGLLHIPETSPFNSFRIPMGISQNIDRVVGPILSTSSARGVNRQHNPLGAVAGQEAPSAIGLPPNENDVTSLIGMGFSEDAVRRALAEAFNDVDRASNILLDGGQ